MHTINFSRQPTDVHAKVTVWLQEDQAAVYHNYICSKLTFLFPLAPRNRSLQVWQCCKCRVRPTYRGLWSHEGWRRGSSSRQEFPAPKIYQVWSLAILRRLLLFSKSELTKTLSQVRRNIAGRFHISLLTEAIITLQASVFTLFWLFSIYSLYFSISGRDRRDTLRSHKAGQINQRILS